MRGCTSRAAEAELSGQALGEGDGAALSQETTVSLEGAPDAEVLGVRPRLSRYFSPGNEHETRCQCSV